MSPKEYTNNNKIISKGTPEQNSTYNRRKNGSAKSSKKIKNGVSKDLREGIFRNRIFEIYDNLSDLKSTEELVEEGVQRACKDLLVNILSTEEWRWNLEIRNYISAKKKEEKEGYEKRGFHKIGSVKTRGKSSPPPLLGWCEN